MRNLVATVAAALLVAGALSSPARAADPVSFSCTASAVTVQLGDEPPLNPVTAGGAGKECQPAISGLPTTTESAGLEQLVTARTAYAAVAPGGERPIESEPRARAGAKDLELVPEGGPALGVDAATSSITGRCVNGRPRFVAQSEVANLTLGGVTIVLDGVAQPVARAVSENLGALVDVRLNEVVALEGGGQAVRAAHVRLLPLDGSGPPLADIVVAESAIDLDGDACDPDLPPNNGVVAPDDDAPFVCPEGAVYDAARALCVIPVPGSQTPDSPAGNLTGPGSVVVGPPSKGPSGGIVITLAQARERFPASPCVRGSGPKYVIVGKAGRDRLTGTNRRDRMIGRGGPDRLDGGRRADCVDGGRGGDRLSGGQGRDRLHGGAGRDGLSGGQTGDRMRGGAGRDFLNGGSGADRMLGGAGPDYLNAAAGRDRLWGGAGDDKINAATAGKRERIAGGRGFDKVRANPRDVRHIRSDVERVMITRKLRG